MIGKPYSPFQSRSTVTRFGLQAGLYRRPPSVGRRPLSCRSGHPSACDVCSFDLAGPISRARSMPESKSTIGLVWAPKVPPSFGGAKNRSEKLHNQTKDLIEKPSVELVDGLYLPPRDPRKLNKLLKRNAKDTAGRSWFDMPAPKITPEIKNDLEILKLRHVIDPKKHFKRSEISNTVPKYFQVGTIVESASEFFSSRLTKKERKATLADELLHDDALKAYRKRKLREIHETHRTGGREKWKNKGRRTWKRAKNRRK